MDRSHVSGSFENRRFVVMQGRKWSDPGRSHGAPDPSRVNVVPEFVLLQSSSEERSRRRRTFGLGFALQALGAVLVLCLSALFPSVTPESESNKNLWTAKVILLTPIAPRPVRRAESLPIPKPPTPKPVIETPKIAEPKPVLPPVVVARARIPVPEPPKLQPVAPEPQVARPTLPKWEPKVEVGAFKDSAPADAKLKLPASKVQTGGFGSANGLPGIAQGGSHPNVARVGAFDLPEGPGSGNGSGGEHGAQGRVQSAGFGDGAVAGSGGQGLPGGGQVASAGFADAQSLTHSAPEARPRETTGTFDPVEILSKPNPVYTEEARRLHVQGEVLLKVVFAASGKLQILGVARGLGHGLDQAAVQAAQRIEFKPARRNGQPVDTTATLHILFELAA